MAVLITLTRTSSPSTVKPPCCWTVPSPAAATTSPQTTFEVFVVVPSSVVRSLVMLTKSMRGTTGVMSFSSTVNSVARS